MKKESLVMTLLGRDRPGLVEQLANTVAEHGGNWLECQMARLGGQFAGILRVECAPEGTEDLVAALRGLSSEGLAIELAGPGAPEAAPENRRRLSIAVVGNDRPGIVRRIATTVAGAGANIEELTTRLESAPMAGHPIFHLVGSLSLAPEADPAALAEAVEHLGDDLSVSISNLIQQEKQGRPEAV
jgi:glycine cleavage system regulatory protein